MIYRRSMKRAARWMAALAVGSIACGESTPQPTDSGISAAPDAGVTDAAQEGKPDATSADASATQEVEQYTGQFFDSLCSWLIRCESKLGIAALSQIQCHPYRRAAVTANYLDLLSKGTLRFDAVAAEQCLSQLGAASCQIGAVDLRLCDRALRGTAGDGEGCGSTLACAEGVCELGNTCPGVCRSKALNADCLDNAECVYPNVCRGGTCQPLSQEHGPCDRRSHCAAPFLCAANHQCEAAGAVAGPCVYAVSGDSCEGSLVCRMSGAARACGDGAPIDGACSGDVPCAPGGRCFESRCLRTANRGEACTRSEQCIGLHVCRGGSCVPSAEAGAACDAELPCAEGACVNAACTLLADGQACSPDTAFGECSGYCSNDQCRPRLLENTACRSSSECADGLECREVAAGSRCLPDCSR